MYNHRDKLISLRISSELHEKFQKLVKKHTDINYYAGKNHHRYHGKTLKTHRDYDYAGKYSLADLLEEAIEIVLQKNSE